MAWARDGGQCGTATCGGVVNGGVAFGTSGVVGTVVRVWVSPAGESGSPVIVSPIVIRGMVTSSSMFGSGSPESHAATTANTIAAPQAVATRCRCRADTSPPP